MGLVASNAYYQTQWWGSLPKGSNVVTNLVMSGRIAYMSPRQWFATGQSDYMGLDKALSSTEKTVKPDIVILLQESTFNPAHFANVDKKTLPEFRMFSQSPHSLRGLTRVPTFGGMTWKSEFAFWTGLSPNDFKSQAGTVFYSAVNHVSVSLVHELKKYGYESVVVTPFCPPDYHADNAYKAFGFDRIFQPQDLGYPAKKFTNLWDIQTRDVLKYVKQYLDRPHEKPQIVYALTMREHGPYLTALKEGETFTVCDTEGNAWRTLSNYVQKIKLADDAIAEFEEMVSKSNRPMLFLRFGDHQPSISGTKGYSSDFENPAYLTDFSITDNLGSPYPELGSVTDLTFLAGVLIERLGMTPGSFFSSNIRMRKQAHGLYEECESQKLLSAYRAYIYEKLEIAGR